MNKTTAITLSAIYLGSIVAANWAVSAIGVVPVGFGLMAPAAVYFVGFTLVLRDVLQRQIGKPATVGLIVAGAGLSALISPTLALASGLAFLASESVDLLAFSIVERFGFLRAVIASNAVSIVVDSLVFLSIAFGSLAFLEGQIVGKAAATLAGVAVLAILPRRTVTA